MDGKPQIENALWNERTRWPSSYMGHLDPKQLRWQSDAADEPPGIACNAAKGQERPGQLYCHDDRFCTKDEAGDVATSTVQEPRERRGPF